MVRRLDQARGSYPPGPRVARELLGRHVPVGRQQERHPGQADDRCQVPQQPHVGRAGRGVL
eukprot:4341062-Lingulodinium_polyedra.AAC.1